MILFIDIQMVLDTQLVNTHIYKCINICDKKYVYSTRILPFLFNIFYFKHMLYTQHITFLSMSLNINKCLFILPRLLNSLIDIKFDFLFTVYLCMINKCSDVNVNIQVKEILKFFKITSQNLRKY